MKGAGHKGKQKFKVKEMYLTKLLSTKVSCEGLFCREGWCQAWLIWHNGNRILSRNYASFLYVHQMLNKKLMKVTLLTTIYNHLQR